MGEKPIKSKGKAPEEGGKKGGRPLLYRKEYDTQVQKLARLGATEKQMADFFEVSEETITHWKRTRPEFLRCLAEGRLAADAEVADTLFRRAVGFSRKAVKIFGDAKSGRSLKVEHREYFPPDVQAIIFWLTNRQRQLWKTKFDVVHEVGDSLADRLNAARKRVGHEPKSLPKG